MLAVAQQQLCLLSTPQAEKIQLRARLDQGQKARDSARSQLREMKGKLVYTSVDKIDEQIRNLEHRLEHSRYLHPPVCMEAAR